MKTFDSKFWKLFIPALIGLGVLLFFPYLFTHWSWIDLNIKGSDNINYSLSVMVPFIAIAAALLTFLAFWVQYKANIEQTSQFDAQDKASRIERFENKFYKLLDLHMRNIEGTKIEGFQHNFLEGRKAFVHMFNELRYCFYVCKKHYGNMALDNRLERSITDEELLNLAYIFFYAGVGPSSDVVNEAMIGNRFQKTLVNAIRDELSSIQSNHNDSSRFDIIIPNYGVARLSVRYKPFSGHISRLGHYYRHLFQTVKFVVTHEDEVIESEKTITLEDKKNYLRTLRAQLSDHEQLLLYYNGISGFGGAWLKQEYFTRYKMIHNIPVPLADFGIRPELKFAAEYALDSSLFEWWE